MLGTDGVAGCVYTLSSTEPKVTALPSGFSSELPVSLGWYAAEPSATRQPRFAMVSCQLPEVNLGATKCFWHADDWCLANETDPHGWWPPAVLWKAVSLEQLSSDNGRLLNDHFSAERRYPSWRWNHYVHNASINHSIYKIPRFFQSKYVTVT